MLLSRAQDFSISSSTLFLNPLHNLPLNPTNPMRTTLFSPLSLLRSLSLHHPLHHHHLHLHHHHHRHRRHYYNFIHSVSSCRTLLSHTLPLFKHTHNRISHFSRLAGSSTSVEQVVGVDENWDFQREGEAEAEAEVLKFDDFASIDLRHLSSPSLEVKELEELPEQWRRSKLAWLCKELPAHKSGTLVRILNAQKKWMTQEDVTYVSVHCLRIRENEAGFRVYKWMMQQSKFRFDFALATKLADYMGKERKFAKCREIFDDIINQGRVPSESTFHILIIAYLSASVQGCLEEACSIYNRMIQLGGYQPRLSLHNSLFRALVSKPGGASKYYLRQAEFIFHNLVTSGLDIHKDIFGGLIWLHSYQDTIDKERIASLRDEMQRVGIEESREVLVSILRACAKEGDVEEAEKTWLKLLRCDNGLPSQAFVYKMEVYAKVGQPMKSLEIFRDMQKIQGSTSVVAYHKIIEVLSKAQEIELAESLMREFIESNLKPLMPSFIDLMNMFFNLRLHDKLESVFSQCLEKCRPNRTIYNIFLDSLVKIGNLDEAEGIFNQMLGTEAIGVNTRSCNSILRGFLSSGDYVKAEKIYDLMCQKKYEIEPPLMDKLDYVLSLSRKVVKKPISLKLSKEQREVLVGLLLGGLQMESDEERKNHVIRFEFNANCGSPSLKTHIYDQFHEWLNPSTIASDGSDDIPDRFFTISHSYFGFYADQFWPKGRAMIPKLIHRWLSPRALAYWYMYGGHRASSGDILLKLKGSPEGVENVVKTFRAKSLDCKVKRKGRVFWIGFLGSNASWFWKLIEPYILDEFKVLSQVDGQTLENQMVDNPGINFDSGSESDERDSDHSNDDNS